MDPLAKQLSCPCVQGYAQRDYAKLAAFLGESLGREVTLRFGESLDAFTDDGFDVVIGKRSVVESDAARLGLDVVSLAALAGKDGLTTQRGLVVVCSDDPATTLPDLKQHRIVLGPADCEEKHAAARAVFASHGIDLPPDCPTAASCTSVALKPAACSFMSPTRDGPLAPSTPGKFSTSTPLPSSWPPPMGPAMTTGRRPARAA
jgi:hypothetical protein